MASSTCGNVNKPAYSFAVGANSLNATATDKAGNTAAAAASFTVKAPAGGVVNVMVSFLAASRPDLVKLYTPQVQQILDRVVAAADPKVKAQICEGLRRAGASRGGKGINAGPGAASCVSLKDGSPRAQQFCSI